MHLCIITEIRKLQKCTIPVEFDDFISSVSTQRKFYDKGKTLISFYFQMILI